MTPTAAVEIHEAHALATVCLGRWHKGRAAVTDRLARLGLVVTPATDLIDALDALGTGSFALCVVDLEHEQAAAWIRAIRAQQPDTPIVGVTDPSRPMGAAMALNAGASDLLAWPFHEADVATMVANLSDRAAGRAAGDGSLADELVAQSAAMRQVADLARAAAQHSESVWISGEPGSGRETVARAIHAASARSDAPFIVVRCAEGSPDQADERIFDAEAEAENPAKSRGLDRVGAGGALMRALGGTLVLRDITAAPARVQAKLARLLRDREALLADRRATTPIDVRLVVISDETAAAAFSTGHLRRELRDRVAHATIEVPPLRQRREDIALLASMLLRDLCRALETAPQQFSRAALTVLGALPWSGNGRELRSLVESMVHAVEGPVIQVEDVLAHARLDAAAPRAETAGSLREARAKFECAWISTALMQHHGRVDDAARALGIQRTNLYRKIRQLNVPRALLVRKS